jgi:hypothetical protein
MYKKFGQLSFIIGLFFSIVSLILFGNALLSSSLAGTNLYTAIVFLLFGLAMMFIEKNTAGDQ